MGFLDKLKKKKVPDELPDLALDSFEGKGEKQTVERPTFNQLPVEDNFRKTKKYPDLKRSSLSLPDLNDLDKKDFNKTHKDKQRDVREVTQKSRNDFSKKRGFIEQEDNEGFFDELEEDIDKEISNLDKLESWYKNKSLPRDIDSNMRDYWEKQKNDLGVIGKNFKTRIKEKISKLQILEKDWQNIYFDLMEKEDEIREEESELKKILKEFVELCRNRKGSKKKK